MSAPAGTTTLLDFYRDEVLPRLRAEQVYSDPAHQWHESSDRWRGGCPWHASDSGTSFVVTLENLLWYCAGCGIGGGPIQYVWKRHGSVGTSPGGQDFIRVVRELAELAGVPFPEREMDAAELKAAEDRAARQSALETVYRDCQEELWSERGAAAREYLHDRGLSDEAIRDLELGLYPALRVVAGALRRAGHAVEPGTGAWEKMVGYITLPWRDDYGHALTLYGRWPAKIPPAGQPKTLAQPGEHSKASPLYFDRARRAGHRTLVLVEGVIDAAVAQSRGLTDVVAYVGSTLSHDQLDTLARHRVSAVTICPDPDSGGDTGIKSLLKNGPPGVRVYVAPRLPDNTDPDEFIIGQGVEAWRAHLRQSIRGVVWSAREILKAHDLDGAPGHDAAVEALERLAARLDDDDLTALVNEVSAALKMKPAVLLARLKKARAGSSSEPSKPATRANSAPRPSYRATEHGLVLLKYTANGAIPVPLTNFVARIAADVAEDDGSGETRHSFEIEASLNGITRTGTVSAASFPSMNWAIEILGARAMVYAGQGTRDHSRAAIQFLSQDVTERRVFCHTGWRHVDDAWFFLHGGGAVGAGGAGSDVETRLSGTLARYILPDPPTGERLIRAVRASLGLLDVAPDRITVPLLAAPYRAPLGNVDLSEWLVGPTGVFKSELAALAQQHFGAEMTARKLPASWSSTANAIEGLAFLAKDAVLVVDDFAPGGSATDVQRLHRDADRVIRGQGNNSGRQRMRSDATLRAERPPRGLIIGTGEDTPRGQSVAARQIIVEVEPGVVNIERLTRAQSDAAAGLYAESMSGYLRWLAQRYDDEQATRVRRQAELRDLAVRSEQHRRTAPNLASLMVGLETFARFALDAGAITDPEYTALLDRCWRALGELGDAQRQHQVASEPTRRFLDLLAGALAGGAAHLASRSGVAPASVDPLLCGWRSDFHRGEDGPNVAYRPLGTLVGWIDGQNVYLQPDQAYAVAQRLARDQGEPLAIGQRTLYKRLDERRLLASTSPQRGKLTVRRRIHEENINVLHLHLGAIVQSEPAPPAPPAPGADPDNNSYTEAPTEGRVPGAGSAAGPELSAPRTGPSSTGSVNGSTPAGPVGPVGPVSGPHTPQEDAGHQNGQVPLRRKPCPGCGGTKPDPLTQHCPPCAPIIAQIRADLVRAEWPELRIGAMTFGPGEHRWQMVLAAVPPAVDLSELMRRVAESAEIAERTPL